MQDIIILVIPQKEVEVSEANKKNRKKDSGLKTFLVPLALVEVNEHSNPGINTSSKPNKEEIIVQAFKFHSEGKLAEAEKYYQEFIKLGFHNPQVFSNYGLLLSGYGKLKEAELLTRKAIQIKNDFAEAHFNLGNILTSLGNLEEAKISFRKATKFKPDHAPAHLNLGIILLHLGNLDEAELLIVCKN